MSQRGDLTIRGGTVIDPDRKIFGNRGIISSHQDLTMILPEEEQRIALKTEEINKKFAEFEKALSQNGKEV